MDFCDTSAGKQLSEETSDKWQASVCFYKSSPELVRLHCLTKEDLNDLLSIYTCS